MNDVDRKAERCLVHDMLDRVGAFLSRLELNDRRSHDPR
jgi:hypothetical protein